MTASIVSHLAFAEGDIIKTTRTHRVVGVTKNGFVKTEDVQGVAYFGFHPEGNNGSLRIDMVKRAVRKPQVGDVLDGRQVRETMWRRGTLLRATEGHSLFDPPERPGVLFVLTAEGLWFSTETERSYEFEDVHDHEVYEVVYLP